MTAPVDRRFELKVPPGAVMTPMRIAVGAVPLRPRPDPAAGIDTELVHGETVEAYGRDRGFAHVRAVRDGYVGWSPEATLRPQGPPATHRVRTLRTFLYDGPSIKTPEPLLVPEGALLTVVGAREDFAVLDDGRFAFAAHLEPVDAVAPDYVAVAERYVGAPYLWGGRTSLGLDCSGLVQTALRMAGVAAPRDSDLLEAFYPVLLPVAPDLSGLRRGDAVFWKGHVGLMRDERTLLHANGHHMAVASEPLADAAARILARSFGPITSIRRLA
jgi:hypothetical protein